MHILVPRTSGRPLFRNIKIGNKLIETKKMIAQLSKFQNVSATIESRMIYLRIAASVNKVLQFLLHYLISLCWFCN